MRLIRRIIITWILPRTSRRRPRRRPIPTRTPYLRQSRRVPACTRTSRRRRPSPSRRIPFRTCSSSYRGSQSVRHSSLRLRVEESVVRRGGLARLGCTRCRARLRGLLLLLLLLMRIIVPRRRVRVGIRSRRGRVLLLLLAGSRRSRCRRRSGRSTLSIRVRVIGIRRCRGIIVASSPVLCIAIPRVCIRSCIARRCRGCRSGSCGTGSKARVLISGCSRGRYSWCSCGGGGDSGSRNVIGFEMNGGVVAKGSSGAIGLERSVPAFGRTGR